MFFLQVMRVIQVIRMKMERWCPTMNPSPLSAGASQSQTFGRFFVSTPTKWKCTSTPGISPYLSTPYLISPYSNSPYLTYLGWMWLFLACPCDSMRYGFWFAVTFCFAHSETLLTASLPGDTRNCFEWLQKASDSFAIQLIRYERILRRFLMSLSWIHS